MPLQNFNFGKLLVTYLALVLLGWQGDHVDVDPLHPLHLSDLSSVSINEGENLTHSISNSFTLDVVLSDFYQVTILVDCEGLRLLLFSAIYC